MCILMNILILINAHLMTNVTVHCMNYVLINIV